MDVASATLATYETLAPFYDAFSADYDHETWVGRLETLARLCGLAGWRALDVACGTGKSARPLADRGYRVAACDLSPAMVAIARRRLGPAADVYVADMRRLPPGRTADLVTCLDDAVNYLLTEDDLRAMLASVRGRLRSGGVLMFDTNTLGTYRRAFAQAADTTAGGLRFSWHGLASAEHGAGAIAHAVVEVRKGDRPLAVATHVQRHWPVPVVRRCLREEGFVPDVVVGQTTGARLHDHHDELAHAKTVFVATAAGRRDSRGGAR
jgi:SAM-dependent methyltransferase